MIVISDNSKEVFDIRCVYHDMLDFISELSGESEKVFFKYEHEQYFR